MKLSAKTAPALIRFLGLGMVVGTLAWEVIERLLLLAGVEIDLSIGPIGFDVEVLALWLLVNPGSFLGLIPGALLFRRI